MTLITILFANINRRHMTIGQRAMAVAKIYPEKIERGKGLEIKLNKGQSPRPAPS